MHQIRLRHRSSADEELQQIKVKWGENHESNPHVTIKDEMIFWKGRLMVPQNNHIRDQILQEFHNSAIGGHAGIARTTA
jgi:hypothetical protein